LKSEISELKKWVVKEIACRNQLKNMEGVDEKLNDAELQILEQIKNKIEELMRA
jgi:hypothetical protein